VNTDIFHCNLEAILKPVDTYSKDMVNNNKTLVSHWPEFSAEDLAEKPFYDVQPFFLTPKLKLKKNDGKKLTK
jgi:hypothetical protein